MLHDEIVFVPIRMNSKRFPGKNIAPLGGRPLFCWSLETLDSLGLPVYVYTNWGRQLRDLLDFRPHHVEFLARPPMLDRDDTRGIAIYRSFRDAVPASKYLLAHVTSPFVAAPTYQRLLALVGEQYESASTVQLFQTYVWYQGSPLNFSLPRMQTQTLDPVYIETSAGFSFTSRTLDGGSMTSLDSHGLVVTGARESVDIDHPEDLADAEIYVRVAHGAYDRH